MTIILFISAVVVVILVESNKWQTLLTRPESPNRSVKIIPYIPVFLVVFNRVLTEQYRFVSLEMLIQVVWLTVIEEILFRGLPFLFLSRSRKTFGLLSILFGLYGCVLLQHLSGFLIYTIVNYIYCLSGTYYSFVETTASRIIFNVLMLN